MGKILSSAGKTLIHGFEGFSLSFYGDPYGYPTVGYGHLISKKYTFKKNTTGLAKDSLLTSAQATQLVKDLSLSYTSPITQTKANAFFDSDTATAVQAVNALTLPTGCSFTQAQFDALVSLTYNCGSDVLKTGDVVAMLASKDIFASSLTTTKADACSKLVSKAFSYDRNLQTRRNKEATFFCTGKPYTHKYNVYTL